MHVVLVKVTKRAGESRQQPSTALGGKIVTFDLQRALGENDGKNGGTEPGGGPTW